MQTTPFHLDLLPEDPIFGVNQAFHEDTRPEKISLIVGSYLDEEGKPWPLPSVLLAEKQRKGADFDYLPIQGDPVFLKGMQKLFGSDLVLFQTIGGAGALTLGAEIVKRGVEGARLHVSNPTWINHMPIFKRVGVKVETYPYPDMEGMIDKIEQLSGQDIFLLHLVCHNPTGIDPTIEEWERIAFAFSKSGAIPFFDLAYLGFGEGVKEDLLPLKFFKEKGIPFLMAFSASKSFGLYGERVGALAFSVGSGKQELLSHGKQLIRSNYSNPPRYGASLIATILGDDVLYKQWENDLKIMRHRLRQARHLFLSQMDLHLPQIEKGRGMFGLLPLQNGAVDQLREEHAIFLPASGRISFAGMTPSNTSRIADALTPFII